MASKDQNGANNPNWKGGRRLSDGYVFILNHNHYKANSHGYVFEHLIVAEKKLGRRLESDEVVHHIDENRTNNHPDNLDVMLRSEHFRLHRTGKKVSDETRKKISETRKINGTSYKENNSRWLKSITEDRIILASLLFKTKPEISKFLGIGLNTLYRRIKYYNKKENVPCQAI